KLHNNCTGLNIVLDPNTITVFDDLRLVATQEFIKLFDDFERQWMLNTMYIDLGSHFRFNN
uniref:Uncharacterized protein n=1 Tax=Romanomermis culicivorax TaxID=13658 RepID=A0A915K8W5_ROMCU